MYLTKTIYDNKAKLELGKYIKASNKALEVAGKELYDLLPITIKESDDLNNIEKIYQGLKLKRGELADKIARIHLFGNYWVVDTTLMQSHLNLPIMCIIHDKQGDYRLEDLYNSKSWVDDIRYGWYSATEHRFIGTAVPIKNEAKTSVDINVNAHGSEWVSYLTSHFTVNGFYVRTSAFYNPRCNVEPLKSDLIKIQESLRQLFIDNNIVCPDVIGVE